MPADAGNPIRVIIVEDHPALAYALREMLQADERLIVVDVLGLGRSLFLHPHLDDVDVVLTDVHLPDYDGLELAEALREAHPHIRVVVMSGSGDDRTGIDALARGAFAFLEKGAIGPEVAERLVGAAERRLS